MLLANTLSPLLAADKRCAHCAATFDEYESKKAVVLFTRTYRCVITTHVFLHAGCYDASSEAFYGNMEKARQRHTDGAIDDEFYFVMEKFLGGLIRKHNMRVNK